MKTSSTKTTRITLILLCTFSVWFFILYEYSNLPADQNTKNLSGIITIVNVISNSEHENTFVMYGILAVLIVTHLRIFFGIEFSEVDSSFNRALAQLDVHEQENATQFMEVILSILSGITVLLSYFVSVNNIWVVPIFVLIESILIFIFDIKLFNVLFNIDDDKHANKIIVFNDFIFLIIGILFFLSPVMLTLNMNLSMSLLFLMLVGIYTSILVIEIITGYRESCLSALDSTKTAMQNSTKYLMRRL